MLRMGKTGASLIKKRLKNAPIQYSLAPNEINFRRRQTRIRKAGAGLGREKIGRAETEPFLTQNAKM